MALTCGLTVGLGCVSWQRQRERDRGTDQVEGLPVGSASTWTSVPVPPKRTWLRVSVARWPSRPRKLR